MIPHDTVSVTDNTATTIQLESRRTTRRGPPGMGGGILPRPDRVLHGAQRVEREAVTRCSVATVPVGVDTTLAQVQSLQSVLSRSRLVNRTLRRVVVALAVLMLVGLPSVSAQSPEDLTRLRK